MRNTILSLRLIKSSTNITCLKLLEKAFSRKFLKALVLKKGGKTVAFFVASEVPLSKGKLFEIEAFDVRLIPSVTVFQNMFSIFLNTNIKELREIGDKKIYIVLTVRDKERIEKFISLGRLGFFVDSAMTSEFIRFTKPWREKETLTKLVMSRYIASDTD